MICEAWQVVVVPFPFSDRQEEKKRPALVLSNKKFNRRGSSVMAMITSSAHDPWPGDSNIQDLPAAGLPVPCKVRLKLFTLDNRLISRASGQLSGADRDTVSNHLKTNLF
ncbi:MAG: type II toxin-antitoxin system PemK/MazF family toxin [Acidobacteriota bacterium]|nr:type II toxin-antitoxin system PemK/MazF family toxin [Acidobacteriota bacterium]